MCDHQLTVCQQHQSLRVRGDALPDLGPGLDVVDRNGATASAVIVARERLAEDLHAAAQQKRHVERSLLLDVVIAECAPILQLLANKIQALLVGGNALPVLDLGVDVVNRIGGLNATLVVSLCRPMYDRPHLNLAA